MTEVDPIKKKGNEYGTEIFDEFELLSKFILEPNLNLYGFNPEKFKHHNKNWFTTNTSIEDMHKLRGISENIQLLNSFNKEVEEMIPVGVDRETGKVVYQKGFVVKNRFQDLLNVFMDNTQSINGSSAGRHGGVLKMTRSIIQKQDQTMEDKTGGRRGSFLNFRKKERM